MKLLYAPTLFGLLAFLSLATSSQASPKGDEPLRSQEDAQLAVALESPVIPGLLTQEVVDGEAAITVEAIAEAPGTVEVAEPSTDSLLLSADDPRHGHFYCPPCGRG